MDDLIRRSDVIGLLEDMILFGEYGIIASSFSKADEEKAYQAINDIPDANLCIPCSERLPEKDKDVLLRQSNGDYVVGYLCSDDVFDTDCGFMGLDKITHWMPLPDSVS